MLSWEVGCGASPGVIWRRGGKRVMEFLLAALVRRSPQRAKFEKFSFFMVRPQANTDGRRGQLYFWTEVVQN